MPREASALASVSWTLFTALDRLSAEEEIRPEAVPFVGLVQGDGGIDDLVRKLVQRRRHGETRRHAVHRLEEFLAFLREHELGEKEPRVRPARMARHADRARLAECRRERLPVHW